MRHHHDKARIAPSFRGVTRPWLGYGGINNLAWAGLGWAGVSGRSLCVGCGLVTVRSIVAALGYSSAVLPGRKPADWSFRFQVVIASMRMEKLCCLIVAHGSKDATPRLLMNWYRHVCWMLTGMVIA